MKVHLINIGCKVNFAETSRLKNIFENLNFQVVDSATVANVVLINTCTVTNNSDSFARQLIRRIRKNNSDAFIAVLGCFAQLQSDEILRNTPADAVFGINEKFKIPYLLSELIEQKKQKINKKKSFVTEIDNSKFDFAYSADLETRARAFLKLQDGCSYNCSYCAIPAARGKSRSINFSEILPQIEHLSQANYKEIVITGINLSDYQSKSGENFLSLIRFISKLNFDIRFRISSIEPQIISEELIDLIAKSVNICPHFHIPLQSGSDEILQKMRRRYNSKQFSQVIDLINKKLPNAFIGMDVISGFPGENEANFNETKDFLTQLKFSALHCFTYSQRSGTVAAEMENQVPKTLKKWRTNELIKLSQAKYKEFLAANCNKILKFLPEKYDPKTQFWFGHTENYIGANVDVNNNFNDEKNEITRKLNNEFYEIKLISIENSQQIIACLL